jgi:hypothetical protein
VFSEAIVIKASDYGSSANAGLAFDAPAPGRLDHIMKILVGAGLVTFALAAPTMAMPIASPASTAHSGQAVVPVYYNHYRGGGHGHHYGWGRGHHRGWGNNYHHHHRY